jgi:hypothetical protein
MAEQSSSDHRAAKPASTGWLIASIAFAGQLWITDVTSMSLFWVARIPSERKASPRGSASKPEHVASHSRHRKIALSLAIVGTLAAPFASRTYWTRPTYTVWVPTTAGQKQGLADSLRHCKMDTGNLTIDFMCARDKRVFEEGGDYEYHLDWMKYFAVNIGVAVAIFISVFAMAFLIPAAVRGIAFLVVRYWKWLNA